MILRLYNPGTRNIRAKIELKDTPKEVFLVDMEENKICIVEFKNNKVGLPVGHHKIATLLIK